MTSLHWNVRLMERLMRQKRMEDKELENAGKPLLQTSDVLYTKDYVFSQLTTKESEGDSGSLYMAKRKVNRREQYLVKHAFCDCAANEFVYTKLVQSMGMKMPDAKLFQISEGEKRNYFKTEYILGCQFLDVVNNAPSYEQMRGQAFNWEEYFSFCAMEWMFMESDGIEIILANDGYIYRVDTSASFTIDEMLLARAGVNEQLDGINIKSYIRDQLLTRNYKECWNYIDFELFLRNYTNKYGKECIKPYLIPFFRIQEISDSYIDDIMNTLCYFYPNFIGDYYKLFIKALQNVSNDFLKSHI